MAGVWFSFGTQFDICSAERQLSAESRGIEKHQNGAGLLSGSAVMWGHRNRKEVFLDPEQVTCFVRRDPQRS